MWNWLKRAQSKNHFRVSFRDKDWKDEWLKIFTSQVTKVEMNLVEQILTVHVRQLKAGHIQDLIFHILKDQYKKIDEARVAPIHGGKYEYVFRVGKLVAHAVDFDYDDFRNPVVHKLVFDFDMVQLHSDDAVKVGLPQHVELTKPDSNVFSSNGREVLKESGPVDGNPPMVLGAELRSDR